MATHRHRYVKVALLEPSTTNLMGGIVVGQYGDTMLIERPLPKERAKSVTPRKPRTKKAPTHIEAAAV